MNIKKVILLVALLSTGACDDSTIQDRLKTQEKIAEYYPNNTYYSVFTSDEGGATVFFMCEREREEEGIESLIDDCIAKKFSASEEPLSHIVRTCRYTVAASFCKKI